MQLKLSSSSAPLYLLQKTVQTQNLAEGRKKEFSSCWRETGLNLWCLWSSEAAEKVTAAGLYGASQYQANQTWLESFYKTRPWMWDKRKNDHLKQKMGVTQIPVLLSLSFSSYTHTPWGLLLLWIQPYEHKVMLHVTSAISSDICPKPRRCLDGERRKPSSRESRYWTWVLLLTLCPKLLTTLSLHHMANALTWWVLVPCNSSTD